MAQLDLLNSLAPVEMIPPMEAPLPPSSPRKSEGAYKTISEVSDELQVPQHVLRFWESHFPQVKPSRMRGSRRYYRPEDVDMLKRIKILLYQQGYTIKGAKKVVKGKDTLSKGISAEPVDKVAISSTKKEKPAVSKTDVKSLVAELRSLKSMLSELI